MEEITLISSKNQNLIIMHVFMLDTNTINYLCKNAPFIEKLARLVENEKITLLITHIQIDEINNTPDSGSELKSKLQNFAYNYCKHISTMGSVVEFSKVGESRVSNGEDIDAIIEGNKELINDALITATANSDAQYLVTEDIKLRKKIIKKLPRIKLLFYDEFYEMINSIQ